MGNREKWQAYPLTDLSIAIHPKWLKVYDTGINIGFTWVYMGLPGSCPIKYTALIGIHSRL